MMQEGGYDASADYVRVGVKSGGCSGLSYELKFDKELGENDKVFEDNNVKIAVEKKSFLYLAGTILEFSPIIFNTSHRNPANVSFPTWHLQIGVNP